MPQKCGIFLFYKTNYYIEIIFRVLFKNNSRRFYMKHFKYLSISLLSLIALVGCGANIANNSSNNHDSDPIETVWGDGDANSYDELHEKEEAIEVPESFDGTNVSTISAAGNYYLKGNFDAISITAKKDNVVYVFLDGVTINSTTGIAFGSEKAITLYLVLLNGSTNTIVNDHDSNAFHVKGDVHISGSGTLSVESKQKNAIKVSKDLYVSDVSIIASGANHAITARSLVSFDASFDVNAKAKDGIQLECDSDVIEFTNEQGYAYLINTNFTSDTFGDGIQAVTYVYISGGEYNITTRGEFIPYSAENKALYELENDDFKYVIKNGNYVRVAKDEIRNLNSSYYALKNSCKGIKVDAIEYTDSNSNTVVADGDYLIYVAHVAFININSSDDCIHANSGDVKFENANFSLDTYDDGVHSDDELYIYDCSIVINSSYEGLEGRNVTINGTSTNIVANSIDDGINAATEEWATSNIYIKNGFIRVYASGDGLDANSGLYLQGGTVIVEGPGRMNGSLDSNNIYFEGGLVFACSTSGMTERMTATQNTFVWQGETIDANSKVSITDSKNNILFSYTLKQSCNQIIFSSPDMALQSTYKIVNGSKTVTSISMSSSLTKSGTSGNQGGPGGGRP